MGSENDLSFGKLALSKGFCTKVQLEDALRTLEEVRKLGLKEQLGNILVKKKIIKEAQVKEILRLQAKKSNVKIANYEIIEKVGGRFKLAALIQRRWVQLMQGARPMVDTKGLTDLEVIVKEILEDKIKLEAVPAEAEEDD